MNRNLKLMTMLVALLAVTACESKTASISSERSASIAWDEIASADSVAHAPKNANLIFMR